MTASRLLFYVSGHGYGHATRVAAVIEALKKKAPRLEVFVRTAASPRHFPGAQTRRAELDGGMVQKNALDVDLDKTYLDHAALAKNWDALVAKEARAVESLRPALVIGDIPALGFAAAARAGVPSVALGNFSWDWIFSEYAKKDRRFAEVAKGYGDAYSSAKLLLRLPMSCPMPAFERVEDMPLVVRRSRLARSAARRRLKLTGARPVVLVSFGGFDAGSVDARGSDDLSEFIFIGFTAKPRGLRADWLRLPEHSPVPHVDLVAACDVVLSKPGYGTISEAVAHGARLLYVPRDNFPEIPALIQYVKRNRAGTELSRADFFAGRWRAALERALSRPATAPPATDGASRIAERLLTPVQVC